LLKAQRFLQESAETVWSPRMCEVNCICFQVLATHFEWFQEMFDRMPKDGRETQWRNLCESDTPELQPLPDKMDDVYKPMQRLCVVRAVRSDRLIHAAVVFINSVLGKK